MRTKRIQIVVPLFRDDSCVDVTVSGEVSNGVACVVGVTGLEDELTGYEETYCEGLLEDAARRDDARRAELVPAFQRCA